MIPEEYPKTTIVIYMKKKSVYIYMLFILLCGITHPLSSKEFDTTLEPDSSSIVIQPRACVNTYENQTVSSTVSVVGCSNLAVQNVTVTNSGNLILSAPAEITINGPFEVQLGGLLNIKNDLTQLIFNYTYDASGNRVARRVNSTN